MGSGVISKEQGVQVPYWGMPSLESNTRKKSPLSCFENRVGLPTGLQEPEMCSGIVHACTCLLPVPVQMQQTEICLVPWPACQDCCGTPPPGGTTLLPRPLLPGIFATTWTYNEGRVEPAQKCSCNPPGPKEASNQGRNSHHHHTCICTRKGRANLKMHPKAPRPLPCPQLRWRRLLLWSKAQFPQDSSSKPHPTSQEGRDWTEPGKSPGTHLALALATSTPALPPINVAAARAPWEIMYPLHFGSSSRTKASGYTQTASGLSYTRRHLQDWDR